MYIGAMKTNKYEQVRVLSHSKFRRYTGVSKFIFDMMVLVLESGLQELKIKSGHPNKLSVEDRLLMLLGYYREYRTFFHIGLDYGLNESNVQRNIEQTELILIRSGYFRLEGKKVLQTDKTVKNIRIDVTECLAQRPKKK